MAASDPQKVKLLCSFGGKILPRPSDGVLRYAGGHTLILSLRRSSTLSDLLSKISQIPAGPISAVKYQLPDEDLDALISVSSQEDLDNMMEEFDRLADLSPDGSARMRIFLFSPADVTSAVDEALDTGQTYIDAVNGVGIKRKESLLSATSSKDGMCPMLLSPNAHDTSSSRPGFMEKETLVSSRVEPQHVHLLNPSANVVGFPPSQTFLHPICVSASPENLKPTQGKLGSSAVSGDQIQTNGGNLKPMQGNTDAPLDESSSRADQNVNNGGDKSFLHHPLGQHPTLHPSFVQNNAYFPPLRPVPQQGLRYADCQMCQRSLPHAHSDTLINEHPNGNGTVSGALQSYHSEDPMKLQSFKMESPVEPKAETVAIASDPFSRQQENGRLVNPNTEVLEHPKVLHPQGAIGVGGELARLQAPLRVVTGDLHTESEPNTLPTGDQFVGNGFSHDVSHTHEKEKPVHLDIEAQDPDKVLHPQREVRVDNVAPSAHFGAYGFTQLPAIPQSYERLHLNPNMHTVIGLPANSHAAYGLFAHASQYRDVDYFPPLSQQMVQTNHLVRQDCRSVMNVNTPPSSVSVPEVSHEYFPPLLQQIVHPNHLVKQDCSSFMNGNLPPSSVSVPKVSHDYFAPSSEQMVHPNHLFNKDCSSVMNGNLTPSSVSVPEVSHDYFPPLSPQNIRPNHLVKQDCNSVMNGNLHLSSALVPEVPHNYARPIDGMMEGLCVNTFEPSMSTEYVRPTPASNLAVPMLKTSTLTGEKIHTDREQVGGNSVLYENGFSKSRIAPENKTMNQLPPSSADLINTEHPPLAADNNQALRSQVGHNLVYLGNAHISPGNLQDCIAVRPVHQIPPPSLDFTCMHTIQPAEMSQSSVIGNHGKMFAYSQEMRVQPEVSNERLGMTPSYSCGISPAYSNGVASLVPLGERKGEALNLPLKDGMVNNVSVPPSVTVPIKYANPSASNGHTEQIQLSTPSELLLCNHDPRKVVGNAQMAPPLLGEVLTKEFVVAKDLCAENYVVNSKDLDVVVLLEEGGLNHLQNPSNKDIYPEPDRFIQGEEQNRQEVQASAEQVLASGLEPSLPPAPVVFPHKRVEADLLSNKESELSKANTLTQAVAPVVDKKIEGITNKQADKMNFSFPLTDDIGRLQIIKNSDLEELRELGSGTFGTVYHGNWRGSDVAIKRISNRCFAGKPSEEERMRADFWKEACMLADLHHPNIVAFYGVVLDGPGGSFATVTEFMVNGSLRLALEKNDKTLDKRKRLLIAMDVAFGMEYLHSKNLIHFDLKSDNLLVNLRDPQRPICKVADLGLSKVKHQTLISGGVQGTLPWMAPELLNGGSNRVSQKVDVFSFGIVMWELLTGEEPYADLHYGTVIGGIVSNTLRPSVPETCDADWRSLMEQCWSAEPSERPNFTEIASRLRLMAACFPQKG